MKKLTPEKIEQLKKDLPKHRKYVEDKIHQISTGELDKRYLLFYKKWLEYIGYREQYGWRINAK